MNPSEREIGRSSRARADLAELLEIKNPQAKDIEKSRAMGGFWDHARTDRDVSRYDVADMLDISPAELRGIEIGMKPLDFWRGQFPMKYGEVLKDIYLYPEFCEAFGIQPFTPEKS